MDICLQSYVIARGERERLFGSREREGKLKIPFPFYGKGTGIRKCYGKGMGKEPGSLKGLVKLWTICRVLVLPGLQIDSKADHDPHAN